MNMTWADETAKHITQNTEIPKRAFTEEETAHYTATSRSFLRQSRMDGHREKRTPGPRYIKVGARMIRYLREDLDAWLEACREEAKIGAGDEK